MTVEITSLQRELRQRSSDLIACLMAPDCESRLLLALRDALQHLQYVLSGDEAVLEMRRWHGHNDAVDLDQHLRAAEAELRSALDRAAAQLDAGAIAAIDSLLRDFATFAARVSPGHRGPLRSGGGRERASAVTPSQVPRERGRGGMPSQLSVPGEGSGQDLPEPEQVMFCASAPQRACPRDEFIARFAAYLKEDEVEVKARLAGHSSGTQGTTGPRHGGLRRGTSVEVVLAGQDCLIDGGGAVAVQRFVWDGQTQYLDFGVQVATDAAPRRAMLKFEVLVGGMSLVRLLLEMEITASRDDGLGRTPDVRAERLPSSAFASYSSKDRLRVLDRVAAIRIAAGIDVFLDCMDLNPSEEWEPRLRQEIERRELFILFWSQAAAQSKWVTWEWEHALALKGQASMQVQPLENGVTPPRRLRQVHLADPSMDVRAMELRRRTGAGGHIH